MSEYQEKASVVAIELLSTDVFRLTLHAPLIAGAAHPGQFVMVRVGSLLDPLLRRPFSIHHVVATGDIQLLFKVVGRGTLKLSKLQSGMTVDIIGPLGRGFPIHRKEPVCLVGGGMGIAPLYFLARRLLLTDRPPDTDFVLLGAQNQEELSPLADSFFDLGYQVRTATDDGSLGHHGFVSDLLDDVPAKVKRVYVCGPFPMMRIVAGKCMKAGVLCHVSLETHMACGLGACLGCTVMGADNNYVHVCKQGPVFSAGEIEWTL